MFNPDDYYPTQEDYEEAKRNGISRQCVNERIRRHGWEKHRAISTPPKEYKNRSDIMKIAKANGITSNQWRNRVYIGWSEIEAASTPLRSLLDKGECKAGS